MERKNIYYDCEFIWSIWYQHNFAYSQLGTNRLCMCKIKNNTRWRKGKMTQSEVGKAVPMVRSHCYLTLLSFIIKSK